MTEEIKLSLTKKETHELQQGLSGNLMYLMSQEEKNGYLSRFQSKKYSQIRRLLEKIRQAEKEALEA